MHAGLGGSASIWYGWTTPKTERVSFGTEGSELTDTILAVYTGQSINGLTAIASTNDIHGGDRHSRVSFEAQAGTTYRIEVVSNCAHELCALEQDVVRLSWRPELWGHLDAAYQTPGGVRIEGWAIDTDTVNPIDVTSMSTSSSQPRRRPRSLGPTSVVCSHRTGRATASTSPFPNRRLWRNTRSASTASTSVPV